MCPEDSHGPGLLRQENNFGRSHTGDHGTPHSRSQIWANDNTPFLSLCMLMLRRSFLFFTAMRRSFMHTFSGLISLSNAGNKTDAAANVGIHSLFPRLTAGERKKNNLLTGNIHKITSPVKKSTTQLQCETMMNFVAEEAENCETFRQRKN